MDAHQSDSIWRRTAPYFGGMLVVVAVWTVFVPVVFRHRSTHEQALIYTVGAGLIGLVMIVSLAVVTSKYVKENEPRD